MPKNKTLKRSNHPNEKLTNRQILAIFRDRTTGVSLLTERYGVDRSLIYLIRWRQRYAKLLKNEPDRFRENRRAYHSGNYTLTEKQALAILDARRRGSTYSQLAKEYGVHYTTIWRLVNGKTHYNRIKRK